MSASKVQRRVQTAGRVGWLLRNPCTISEVAKSYGLVPQTVGNWVNKWRKTHSGIEGEEMTAAQLAEYKKIKAELREARTEDRVLEKKRRPSSAPGVPAKNTIRIHPSAKKATTRPV